MSENLIESVAPHLAPPVAREAIHSAHTGEGAELATPPYGWPTPLFVDDDTE